MTNFEFYKDEIKAVGYEFGMDRDNAKIEGCTYELCKNCKFSEKFTTHGTCVPSRIIWLYSEHKEQPKLTKNERKLCEIISPDCYIARDRPGIIYVYATKPSKHEKVLVWDGKTSTLFSVLGFRDCDFSFIKWKDEEPWKVSDLLKLEVEE